MSRIWNKAKFCDWRRAVAAKRMPFNAGLCVVAGILPSRGPDDDALYAFTNGRLEVGLPVNTRRALATAGAMTGVPGSPTPVGWLSDGMI